MTKHPGNTVSNVDGIHHPKTYLEDNICRTITNTESSKCAGGIDISVLNTPPDSTQGSRGSSSLVNPYIPVCRSWRRCAWPPLEVHASPTRGKRGRSQAGPPAWRSWWLMLWGAKLRERISMSYIEADGTSRRRCRASSNCLTQRHASSLPGGLEQGAVLSGDGAQ